MAIKDWKTTVSGLASGFLATAAVILAPESPLHSYKYGAYLALSAGIVKAWVGILMKDAGTQEVKTPSGELETKPSHESPDDPRDVPVVAK